MQKEEQLLKDVLDNLVTTYCWVSHAHKSKFVCSALVDKPALVQGKSVLEIGAGTGLCGIVAAKLGAAHVTPNSHSHCFSYAWQCYDHAQHDGSVLPDTPM